MSVYTEGEFLRCWFWARRIWLGVSAAGSDSGAIAFPGFVNATNTQHFRQHSPSHNYVLVLRPTWDDNAENVVTSEVAMTTTATLTSDRKVDGLYGFSIWHQGVHLFNASFFFFYLFTWKASGTHHLILLHEIIIFCFTSHLITWQWLFIKSCRMSIFWIAALL